MSERKQSGLAWAEERLQARNLSTAIAAFNEAENCGEDPDCCAAGRWLAQMLLGNFETAWRESDAIRKRGAPDPNRFWQGENLTGKRVILRCLHGLGDAVQFLRYAPAIQKQASELIVEVPPAMVELAPHFHGVDRVVTWGGDVFSRLPVWDVQIEINELPYLFRTQLEDLPLTTDYLRMPDPWLKVTQPQPACEDSLRVGVVWACGEWNPSRSVPLEMLSPVLDTCGCEFWNLQGGNARTQWGQLPRRRQWHDADICAESLPHLAALIAQLDLVITPDTLAAHLAGAQSVPAWVLLEHAADWRWYHAGCDSPWYPSLRLFRQPARGDWVAALDDVQLILNQHVVMQRRRRLLS